MSARLRARIAERAGTLAGLASSLAVGAALVWWMSADPTRALVARRPGMDGPGQAKSVDESVTVGESFETFDGTPGGPSGSWPAFRGPARDNVVPGATVSEHWGPDGPQRLWSIALGEGHAGPAVADGRVFILDYDEQKRSDALRCFSLADGREIWRRSYRVRLKRNHGFSRTVPAVEGRLVVSVGPRGHVMAVESDTGRLLWGLDLEKEYGSAIPLWYSGQCPLIDDGVVVLAPAGRQALLVGVEGTTGRALWSVPNTHGWQMSHTSVMTMALGGRRMYVYSALGGMVGVAADGADRGRVLWETTLWSQAVLAPSPLILPNGRLFVTAGYGAGSMLLQVSPAAEGFSVSEVGRFPPTAGLASEQQTPVLFDGHVFGIQPKDAGAQRNQLVCYSAGDVRTPVWVSGPTHRFGLGPYLVVGDRLLILDDDGVLTLAEASTTGYRQLAQAQVLDGVDAWAPMALVGGRLLLRDTRRLICLDLGGAEGV